MTPQLETDRGRPSDLAPDLSKSGDPTAAVFKIYLRNEFSI
jgi:hypothetical protein